MEIGDGIGDGDEELSGPRASSTWPWRIGVGLGTAVLVAAVVVGLVRHDSSKTGSHPKTAIAGTAVVSSPGTTSAQTIDGVDQSFNVGQHGTTVNLYGPAVLLFSPCTTACSESFAVPVEVARALRTAVPGCVPVMNESESRRSGRSVVQQREAACVVARTTLLVNIARVHSRLPDQDDLDGGALVGAALVRGPYTVQVFLQNREGPHPSLAVVRALASDPRLLAGTD